MSRSTKVFSEDDWIYRPGYYCEHREVLGTVGEHPVIVIGVNPSTAEPGNLDPTLKSVDRISKANGFDSFIMFNLYPQRATNPDEMDVVCNEEYRQLNRESFEAVLKNISNPVVWCAWGNLIEKREYLKNCLRDLIDIGDTFGVFWVCAGSISKKGHPHHPLYLKRSEEFKVFPMTEYIITQNAESAN